MIFLSSLMPVFLQLRGDFRSGCRVIGSGRIPLPAGTARWQAALCLPNFYEYQYISGGARNALEWIDVSIAAADQAGMSVAMQAKLRKTMLNAMEGIAEKENQ